MPWNHAGKSHPLTNSSLGGNFSRTLRAIVAFVFFFTQRGIFKPARLLPFWGKVVGLDYLRKRVVWIENLDHQTRPVWNFILSPSLGPNVSAQWEASVDLSIGVVGGIGWQNHFSGPAAVWALPTLTVQRCPDRLSSRRRFQKRASEHLGKKRVKFGRNSCGIRAGFGRNSGENRATFGQ